MKKWIGLAAALTISLAVLPALAATDLSIGQYENLVSTHSIDAAIPSYHEYLQSHDAIRPVAKIILEGAEAVRYEEEGLSAPVVLSDYDGMAGDALLTREKYSGCWYFEY